MSGVEEEVEPEWRDAEEHDVIEEELGHDGVDIGYPSWVAKYGTAFVVHLERDGKFIVSDDHHANPLQIILLFRWYLHHNVRWSHIVRLHADLIIRAKSVGNLDARDGRSEYQIAERSEGSCEVSEVLRAKTSAIQHVSAVEASSEQIYCGSLGYNIMEAH